MLVMRISKKLSTNLSLLKLMLCLVTAINATVSLAQDSDNQGFSLTTELSLASDSNIERNSTETAGNLLQFAPQIRYVNIIGKHQFSADYTGIYAKYSEQTQFDYENHTASIGILFDHTESLSTEFNLSYQDAIEAPGSTNGILVDSTEFNQFTSSQMTAAVLYGTRESKGQIIVTFDINNIEFTNIDQVFRNSDITSITGGYFYRIAPSTRLLFEVGQTDIDYIDAIGLNDQSSQQNTYLTGIEWVSSEQTTSVFRIGYVTRDFENSLIEERDGLTYSLDFIWQPKSYTQVSFVAARGITESAIQGSAGIITENYSIDLQHELSSLIALNSVLQYSEDDIEDRTDTNTTFEVGLSYSAKDWLNIRLSYALENRQSNNILFDYDAELIQLSFVATFD
jgi:hypothetical protein